SKETTSSIKSDISTMSAGENKNAVPVSEWIGVFRATNPKPGDANVTVQVSPTGDLTFQSSSGLRGKGRMTEESGKITASVVATSPRGADGRPVFGASEIVFDLNGSIRNGVMTGGYTSVAESGVFVLCDAEARKNSDVNCSEPPSGGAVLKNVLDVLKVLTGK
ncbi:MAG: hypothetical protein AB1810_09665, partial [Pseudomonadota bacterium]